MFIKYYSNSIMLIIAKDTQSNFEIIKLNYSVHIITIKLLTICYKILRKLNSFLFIVTWNLIEFSKKTIYKTTNNAVMIKVIIKKKLI